MAILTAARRKSSKRRFITSLHGNSPFVHSDDFPHARDSIRSITQCLSPRDVTRRTSTERWRGNVQGACLIRRYAIKPPVSVAKRLVNIPVNTTQRPQCYGNSREWFTRRVERQPLTNLRLSLEIVTCAKCPRVYREANCIMLGGERKKKKNYTTRSFCRTCRRNSSIEAVRHVSTYFCVSLTSLWDCKKGELYTRG